MAEQTVVVVFGNSNPQHMHPGESARRKAEHLKQSETRVVYQPDVFDMSHDGEGGALSTNNDRILSLIARTLKPAERKYAVAISEMEQILAVHTAGENPDWVASSDPAFAKVLAKHFDIPVMPLSEVEGRESGPTMLLTNGGRDALHSQFMNTAAPPATFNYMALANSATATTPAATDTTLTGEITTAGGGLIRAQATYAHTAGTNTTTLTKTFTANGSDSLPVTASQMAVFNAATSGTMALKTPLNSNATMSISGDNVTITETVTIG